MRSNLIQDLTIDVIHGLGWIWLILAAMNSPGRSTPFARDRISDRNGWAAEPPAGRAERRPLGCLCHGAAVDRDCACGRMPTRRA